jgi:hypothetical protein
VEVAKSGFERGYYIHLELYGAPRGEADRMGPPSEDDEKNERVANFGHNLNEALTSS